jgi:transposase
LDIRWETVKNIDKAYLMETLPALDPAELAGLEYIGVDEVARAKGHDYMTVVYDMVGGHLIWVEAGRTAEVFSRFLKQLQPDTACKIKAVAMDMGPPTKRLSESPCRWPTLYLTVSTS